MQNFIHGYIGYVRLSSAFQYDIKVKRWFRPLVFIGLDNGLAFFRINLKDLMSLVMLPIIFFTSQIVFIHLNGIVKSFQKLQGWHLLFKRSCKSVKSKNRSEAALWFLLITDFFWVTFIHWFLFFWPVRCCCQLTCKSWLFKQLFNAS